MIVTKARQAGGAIYLTITDDDGIEHDFEFGSEPPEGVSDEDHQLACVREAALLVKIKIEQAPVEESTLDIEGAEV